MSPPPQPARPGYSLRIRDMAAGQRPRERLERHGASSLNEAELLAIVLRTGSQRGSAIELAQALVNGFGGLRGLADASFTEIRAQHGVGVAKAAQIKAALELARRLQLEALDTRPQVRSPQDAARILAPRMSELGDETLQVMLLDARHRVIEISQVAQGSVNTVGARMADIFREAVRLNSPAVILAHNHPSGDATPSQEDAALTRSAAEAGKILGVEVLDHVVVARGPSNFVSLREQGIEW